MALFASIFASLAAIKAVVDIIAVSISTIQSFSGNSIITTIGDIGMEITGLFVKMVISIGAEKIKIITEIKGLLFKFLEGFARDVGRTTRWFVTWGVGSLSQVVSALQVSVFHVLRHIGKLASGTSEALEEIWDLVGSMVPGEVSGVIAKITTIKDYIWDGLKTVAERSWGFITTISSNVWSYINDISLNTWAHLKTMTGSLWNGIKGMGSTIMNKLGEFSVNVLEELRKFTVEQLQVIRETATSTWEWLRDEAQSLLEAIQETSGDAWEWITNKGEVLYTEIKTLYEAVTSFIEVSAPAWADRLGGMVANQALKGTLRNKISQVIVALKSKSYSEIWKHGVSLMMTTTEQFGQGVVDYLIGRIGTAVAGILGDVEALLQPIKDTLEAVNITLGSLEKFIPESLRGTFDTITGWISSITDPIIELIDDVLVATNYRLYHMRAKRLVPELTILRPLLSKTSDWGPDMEMYLINLGRILRQI